MTDLSQAAQQALEFLESGSFVYPARLATALREALAQPVQPVQESVGEVTEVSDNGFRCEFSQCLAVGTKLYTFPPAAQPVQEPVISAWSLREVYFDADGEPSMHRSPPQREWVELTEDEIKGTWAQLWYDLTHGKLSTPDNEVRNNVVMFGQALEAKLKEKNNG